MNQLQQVNRSGAELGSDSGQAEPQPDRSLHLVRLYEPGSQDLSEFVCVLVREIDKRDSSPFVSFSRPRAT
jgi:hypothetical protein